ncbi:hypothetical protein VC83_07141 [Pseudogymnoascus destructans]|uniref:HAT C-terminal dimerisation domain-containing protein n=1 Tax=Pseudogymnoascus destructans TaxID=655981 RepID=A0A177A3A5_9PEZI|nr:uncharacterized protein VC83_07141 [Pseudogymnoascus destructans]OAF56587.1 hypothetical protein VC83_07141 [Pseudogymnoascus destructans]
MKIKEERLSDTLPSPPLKWWKENERLFPGLAAMARNILCIPASEALVEQVFSTARAVYIIDSTYMNDEEILFEYHALIDNIQEKMTLQYIPDRSPRQPNTYDRTKRNQDRFDFIQSRRGRPLQMVQQSQSYRQGQRRQM